MDQELITYFDEHFRKASRYTESLHEKTTQQIAGLRQETMEQIAGLRQETMEQIRHTQVLVEGLHDQIRLLAEGFIGIEERMQSSQREVAEEFRAVGNTIGLHYRDLESRIRVVEERTEREGRDPMDIIRERYGRTG